MIIIIINRKLCADFATLKPASVCFCLYRNYVYIHSIQSIASIGNWVHCRESRSHTHTHALSPNHLQTKEMMLVVLTWKSKPDKATVRYWLCLMCVSIDSSLEQRLCKHVFGIFDINIYILFDLNIKKRQTIHAKIVPFDFQWRAYNVCMHCLLIDSVYLKFPFRHVLFFHPHIISSQIGLHEMNMKKDEAARRSGGWDGGRSNRSQTWDAGVSFDVKQNMTVKWIEKRFTALSIYIIYLSLFFMAENSAECFWRQAASIAHRNTHTHTIHIRTNKTPSWIWIRIEHNKV